MISYKQNRKSHETKIKELLKNIKESYKHFEHKAWMEKMREGKTELHFFYKEREEKLRKDYDIIKANGINYLPKKKDREYYEGLYHKLGWTQYEQI
jgi:hypothetical protein